MTKTKSKKANNNAKRLHKKQSVLSTKSKKIIPKRNEIIHGTLLNIILLPVRFLTSIITNFFQASLILARPSRKSKRK